MRAQAAVEDTEEEQLTAYEQQRADNIKRNAMVFTLKTQMLNILQFYYK